MQPSPPSSIKLDVASAYVAPGARIGVWIVISALVYRFISPEAFALLALVRGTVGLLGYVAAGIAPATISLLAEARRKDALPVAALAAEPARGGVLSYYRASEEITEERIAYSTANTLVWALAVAGYVLMVGYALSSPSLHVFPRKLRDDLVGAAANIGLGILLRLLSEPAGAVLQTRGKISRDNLCIAASEVLWLVLAAATIGKREVAVVSAMYAASGLILLVLRRFLASRLAGKPRWKLASRPMARQLVQFGGLLVVAQLADFLYAPTDYILINRLIAPAAVADYAPAVQIASGLLLLTAAIAAVLLPRSALAHSTGDVSRLRAYYLRGTLASAGILAVACALVYILAPWLLHAWLGNPMPATQAILPLMLLGTMLGGCGSVGNAILLGTGRIRVYAAAAFVTGIANVALTILFVAGLKLGLQGVVLGSVLAVGMRNALWLPWYINRKLR